MGALLEVQGVEKSSGLLKAVDGLSLEARAGPMAGALRPPGPGRRRDRDLSKGNQQKMLLGFLFWFALLTTIAAIMDDPHTSMRTQFMFLPMLPLIPAFSAISDPGAGWVRILGVLPPTSSAVLPVRLVTGEVPWWEVLVAAVLLVGAVWAMIRLAGPVFRTGMLMYGKEPTWGEVRRWIREA